MSFDSNINPRASFGALAPAKINLALHITGQRDDGYHLLDSLVGFADFGDQLTIVPAPDATSLVGLEITGPFARDLLNDSQKELDNNLVTRAANTLAQAYQKTGFKCPNIRIILEKNMPIASGIGGGSADAAAVLLKLEKIWNSDFSPDLHSIAAQLGADVPMCLSRQPKRIGGAGEHLSEFYLPVSLPLLLVNPLIPLSTPKVFDALTDKNNVPISIEKKYSIGQSGFWGGVGNTALVEKAVELLSPLRNDLQIPAASLVPEIHDVLLALEQQPDCHLARMSGSGATCFGIFSTPAEANNALTTIKERYPHWWSVVCATLPSRSSVR